MRITFQGCRLDWSFSFLMAQLKWNWQCWHSCCGEFVKTSIVAFLDSFHEDNVTYWEVSRTCHYLFLSISSYDHIMAIIPFIAHIVDTFMICRKTIKVDLLCKGLCPEENIKPRYVFPQFNIIKNAPTWTDVLLRMLLNLRCKEPVCLQVSIRNSQMYWKRIRQLTYVIQAFWFIYITFWILIFIFYRCWKLFLYHFIYSCTRFPKS